MSKVYAALFLWMIAVSSSPNPAFASAGPENPALSRISELAHSKAWLRLLHYHHSFPWGTFESELAGSGFFIAPTGNRDPEAELKADLEAFADPQRLFGLASRPKQPAQCAFPVRYEMLKRELKLTTPDLPCPEHRAFLERFKAHSVTLVFSSAYPSSPASMFGHSFLRINAKATAEGQKLDLLDTGLNYSALVPENENSFVFAFMGVTGGYPGLFSTEPYYMKVREYNNGESRDLWEYELGLSEAESVRLLSHTWEIESTSGFFYYFGTQNCSYQLLALLEAVRPDWDLTGHFIHVIPSETIKKVVSVPGAVAQVRLRPSLRKRVLMEYDSLTAQEHGTFEDLISRKSAPSSVDSAHALDVAIGYFHYRKESHSGNLSDEDQALLRQVLIRRSQLKDEPLLTAAAIDPSGNPKLMDTRPDTGHYPYRVGLSGGAMSANSAGTVLGPSLGFLDLNLKIAYHDLLNDDRGYSRFSEIDFPVLTLRYRPADNRLSIEQFLLSTITALNPHTLVDQKFAWHIRGDYYSAKDFGCIDCHLLRADGAVGEAMTYLSSNAIVYGFFHGYFEGGESLAGSVRGGPRLEISTIVNPVAPYKTKLSLYAVTDIFQSARPWIYYQLEWDHSLSLGPYWEIRAGFQRYFHTAPAGDYGEAKLTLNRYF